MIISLSLIYLRREAFFQLKEVLQFTTQPFLRKSNYLQVLLYNLANLAKSVMLIFLSPLESTFPHSTPSVTICPAIHLPVFISFAETVTSQVSPGLHFKVVISHPEPKLRFEQYL